MASILSRFKFLLVSACFVTAAYVLFVNRSILPSTFNSIINYWTSSPYEGVERYITYSTAHLDLRELPGSRPIRPELGPVVNDVTSFKFPIGVDACTNDKLLFIAIVSAPDHFDKRKHIRLTWMKHLQVPTRHAFIVGKTADASVERKIQEEYARHSDIIQADVIDSYHNLSLKAVALLSWLQSNCPQVPFILKCDDDVYVNVHNLETMLHGLPRNGQPSIYGVINAYSRVLRNTGKWGVSYDLWPWSTYPPYFPGGSILISGSAVTPLLAAAQTTPYFFIDDIYLSGLCASKAGISLSSSLRMFSVDLAAKDEGKADPCFVDRHVSWLTNSGGQMIHSYRATGMFYEGKTHCSYEKPAKHFTFDTIR